MKIRNGLRAKVCTCGEINNENARRCADATCGADLTGITVTSPTELMLAAFESLLPAPRVLDDLELQRIAVANRTLLVDEPILVNVDGFSADAGNHIRSLANQGATAALGNDRLRVRLHDESLQAILRPMGDGMTRLQDGVNTRFGNVDDVLEQNGRQNNNKSALVVGGLTLFAVLALIVLFFAFRAPVPATAQPTDPAAPTSVAAPTLSRGACIQHCVASQISVGFDAGQSQIACASDPGCMALPN